MRQDFITNTFLLQNKYAEELYFNYAEKLPIIDYHNHLPPKHIADNTSFENITQLWVAGDHYKWRAMRTLGISEEFITGNASDKEKFKAWINCIPSTVRNPLYHWSHLELKRYFGRSGIVKAEEGELLFDELSAAVQQPNFTCKALLERMNVEVLCTTEDPTDELQDHQKIAASDFNIKVSTAFRPDRFLDINHAHYLQFLEDLSKASGIEISSVTNLKEALKNRLIYFHENGCKLSDHGLNHLPFQSYSDQDIKTIFENRLQHKLVNKTQEEQFKTAMLSFLCELYNEYDFIQQFHLGALRNTNTRMLEKLGPDTGWDSIGDFSQASKMAQFFNNLDCNNKLTKTIIYNNNPKDNPVFATMVGNFNDGSVKGKMQYGSGWWYLDQKDGMTAQINTLSNMGILSCFVGMLTDSRSFMSFPRHEYFRRILCNIFGNDIANGEIPGDIDHIGSIISDICYHNAKNYFNF
ncbi:glucuronate isomerase [Zhouia sp. PK063]|uniref:glucuronate isomerase n=1 Tax=Zhouia sp. PK063 TaxID=3373602 RepID=UPI0037A34640